MSAIVPIPRCEMSIRVATASDYAFIDRLAAMHSKALGFMPRAQLEGKIAAGHILIAEEAEGLGLRLGLRLGNEQVPNLNPNPNPNPVSLGYCMSQDRYFKRDDVGIIYQMNVLPTAQRKLVGAMLLKAVFDRAAYGCKLFCCWCAQDLDANYFWESLGFVPLAFRAGASGRSARSQPRTHIFWQRRIREGDTTTPYWFPAKTDGGMMREDRLVLPIPPGVHWKDPMPILLPDHRVLGEDKKRLPGSTRTPKPQPPNPNKTALGKLWFPSSAKPVGEKPKQGGRAKKPKTKADPVLIAKARELRDRWLEKVNADGGAALLASAGKYEVSRALEARDVVEPQARLLSHAA